MSNDLKRVGLIVGREWSMPPALIEEINSRDQGVVAEFARLGGTRENEPCPYDVLVDRISHEIPYYRTYLKNAALQGTRVINNPFMWSSDDKFFGASLATELGVAHPKTVVLPNRDYIPDITSESLSNLEYPLDWDAILDYIGLPAVLKDAYGGGWKEVYIVKSKEELLYRYNDAGRLTMVLQEFIKWEHYVRVMVLGQSWVLPMKYDPGERRYYVEHEHMSQELGDRVVGDSLKLCKALGYDMNTLEFAVRDGIPYALDFMNPAPDMDIYSLTPVYFRDVINAMADLCIRYAQMGRVDYQGEIVWNKFMSGGL
ncbi:MAG: hypothetical protein KIT87_13525 [Anaerolineae bacterium]|nr:hypothetical protein [Anaerolineae bacterium]